MVCCCCVRHCPNKIKSTRGRTNTSMYRFPRVRKRYSEKYKTLLHQQRLAWIAALRRDEFSEADLDWLRICNEHFATGAPSDFRDTDNPDWVPHLNMGYEASDDECESVKVESMNCDYEIVTLSENHCEETLSENHYEETLSENHCEETLSENHCEETLSENDCEEVECQVSFDLELETESNTLEYSSTSVQTDVSSAYIAALEAEIQKRTEEVYELRQRLADALWTEETFKNDDHKVAYYSGFPSFRLLKSVFNRLEPGLCRIKLKNLDNFQKLLLTLMKLRFNSPYVDLAYRFRIRKDNASRCFREVVVLIAHTFQGFLHWPDRESLRTAMPCCFKEAFGNSVVVIVDCFEIPTQRPADAETRVKSISNGTYTTKYLVGVTPHGFISFVSDGYEGGASDEFISEQSGLLEHLMAGDVVMNDRGFAAKESVSARTELAPHFLENKSQLSVQTVEKTKKMASVRAHVQRVVAVMKNKFQILKGPVPAEFLRFKHDGKSVLDYVVRSACILTNLRDSIVPTEEARSNENVNALPSENLFADKLHFVK